MNKKKKTELDRIVDDLNEWNEGTQKYLRLIKEERQRIEERMKEKGQERGTKIVIDLEKVDFSLWESLYKFLAETNILKHIEIKTDKQEKNI